MKHWHSTALITACLAFLPPALADDHQAGYSEVRAGGPMAAEMHGHFMRRFGHAMRELDLDEAQRERIHDILQNNRADLHANMQATREGMDSLRGIVMADALDHDALSLAAADYGRLAEERILIMGQAIHAVLAELNEDQRAQLLTSGAEYR